MLDSGIQGINIHMNKQIDPENNQESQEQAYPDITAQGRLSSEIVKKNKFTLDNNYDTFTNPEIVSSNNLRPTTNAKSFQEIDLDMEEAVQ